jgi:hypothetical protein
MNDRKVDIVDELRAAVPDGQDQSGEQDVRRRAAAEIERLRAAAGVWQPINTAPKDDVPVLLYCPKLRGHVAREIVVGVWRFDANRRTFGYWVSDVGALDPGFSETGPWIEYRELHPVMWAPLPAPPEAKKKV